MQYKKFAMYWRNSLADAEMGNGRWEIKNNFNVHLEGKDCGIVNIDIVKNLFRDEKDKPFIDIDFYPFVYRKLTEHQQEYNYGEPQIITPIVTKAVMNREGFIFPLITSMPRDILRPLDKDSFSIGELSMLDEYTTKSGIATIDPTEDIELDKFELQWNQYVLDCNDMLSTIAEEWVKNTNFELISYSYVEKRDAQSGANKHIMKLYDHILNSPDLELPLFDIFIKEPTEKLECFADVTTFSKRLGHSSNIYSLADAQRASLTHIAEMSDNEILAVNGPPGTGKTTLLLSVVSSLWVKAALDEAEPPVVVAASSNNQAVTNIIDAFGKDFSSGEGEFAGRWLPSTNYKSKIDSYGAYFVSSYNKDLVALEAKYQTKKFFDSIENTEYVKNAKNEYLKYAAKAFPKIELNLVTVVNELHKQIKSKHDKLVDIQSKWDNLVVITQEFFGIIGYSENRNEIYETLDITVEQYEKARNIYEQYNAQESWFLILLSWIPAVMKKRNNSAKFYFRQQGLDWLITNDFDIRYVNEKIDLYLEALLKLQVALHLWRDAIIDFDVNYKTSTINDIDVICDKTIRFDLFRVATHYWEGRWLLAMENISDIDGEKRKTGKVAQEKWWKRRMMITPCVVSTFSMLPSSFEVSYKDGNSYMPNYLYNFGDLLIVDEAGQVLPETAGASFALFKKALVIGDTQQIEPIWSICRSIDIGNLTDSGLIKGVEEYHSFCKTGKSSTNGSVMRIAQGACKYYYDKDLEPGMFLLEHRRCYNEIVEYCNGLCYKNKLISKRGNAPDNNPLPPMGYLHIDGICTNTKSGSKINKLEAQTIAKWINDNKNELEEKYGKELKEIVGVVTPFSAQSHTIQSELKSYGISAGKGGLTVGTVHSLQGAERAVVIFSMVYSKHLYGRFIDSKKSMLNVAVSRAKDSFLVFGDMDVFSYLTGEPTKKLAEILFSSSSNKLKFEPLVRDDLENNYTKLLHNYSEHDAFLLDILNTAKNKVLIVSPWLLKKHIDEKAIQQAMNNAVNRNVEVTVFTDLEFNNQKHDELLKIVTLLKDRGIKAFVLDRIHSKIVACDDVILCVGSFNWFSASRDDKRSRYDTSIVYKNDNVTDEIESILINLRKRYIN